MSIRVTQHTMYNNMVSNMQKNLGAYMESVEQGSSQKKINRPSDDPAGAYRVLTTRVDMANTAQYQENVDTAKGWLNLADQVLSSNVTTALQGLVALAEQASTGTYDASQREIMADQARQYFGQLLNLSNTRFEGKTIFAGHKYDGSAFDQGLAVTTWDGRNVEDKDTETWVKNINDGQLKVDPLAKSDRTIIVDFTEAKSIEETPKYRWSDDGGVTWSEENMPTQAQNGEDWELDINGVKVTLNGYRKDANGNYLDNKGNIVSKDNGEKLNWATKCEDPEKRDSENCTRLYIRPAAYYNGDDKDPPANITVMGGGKLTKDKITTQGDFGKNVLVRIDGQDDGNGGYKDVGRNGKFTYSYSTDGGSTWITPLEAELKGGQTRLPIPGGYMEINGAGGLKKGAQIMIHPSRADLDYEIMKDTYLEVNSVGKDVFGGWYQGKPALEGSNNLFEVVGSFIGYLEGNCQQGCQETLAALKTAEKQVLAEATRIGGMENRIEMASDVLSYEKIDQQERLSYVEDIDLTELLTKLTRQQLTYQTVLQSSSMIMQLSLANYV